MKGEAAEIRREDRVVREEKPSLTHAHAQSDKQTVAGLLQQHLKL